MISAGDRRKVSLKPLETNSFDLILLDFKMPGMNGTVAGKLQLLTMGRQGNLRSPSIEEDAYSSSLAFSLNYKTPTCQGVSSGIQFIHAWELGEDGNVDIEEGPAWFLSNSGFTNLNNAYVDYNFTHLGLAKTLFRVGRIPLYLDFAPSTASVKKTRPMKRSCCPPRTFPA